MRDVVLIAAVVGFFALASLYVRWCDGVVGADEAEAGTTRGAVGPADAGEPEPVELDR